jgi:hypothetical protein
MTGRRFRVKQGAESAVAARKSISMERKGLDSPVVIRSIHRTVLAGWVVLLAVSPLGAQPEPSSAPVAEPVAPNCYIVFDCSDPACGERARTAIETAGGRVFAAYYLCGATVFVSPERGASLVGKNGIVSVHHGPLEVKKLAPPCRLAAIVWNRRLARDAARSAGRETKNPGLP